MILVHSYISNKYLKSIFNLEILFSDLKREQIIENIVSYSIKNNDFVKLVQTSSLDYNVSRSLFQFRISKKMFNQFLIIIDYLNLENNSLSVGLILEFMIQHYCF